MARKLIFFLWTSHSLEIRRSCTVEKELNKWVQKLFVGALHATSDESLRTHFEEFGEVTETKIVTDRERRSRGFGFVTYAEEASANEAKDALNNSELDGRTIRVDHATEQRPRSGGGRGGHRGGPRGGGGGGRW